MKIIEKCFNLNYNLFKLLVYFGIESSYIFQINLFFKKIKLEFEFNYVSTPDMYAKTPYVHKIKFDSKSAMKYYDMYKAYIFSFLYFEFMVIYVYGGE